MKAITIWQPWAEFIAAGVKHNETRSWATKYRGPIAIHAAVKPIRQMSESSREGPAALPHIAGGYSWNY